MAAGAGLTLVGRRVWRLTNDERTSARIPMRPRYRSSNESQPSERDAELRAIKRTEKVTTGLVWGLLAMAALVVLGVVIWR